MICSDLKRIPALLSFALLCLVLSASGANAAEKRLASPDGKAVIVVTDAGGLSYSVFLDGREVVDKSRFGIVAGGVDLGADVMLKKSSSRRIREKYSMFRGNHCLPASGRQTWN